MKTCHWLLTMGVLLTAASCLNAQTWRWTRDDLVLNPSGLDLRYVSSWAWGDLDKDGLVDVIIRNGQFGGDGRLHVYRGRDSSEPPYWIEAPELLEGLEEQDYALGVSLADLDGDGSLNIITREWREPVWRFLNWQKDSSGKWQADTTAFQTLVLHSELRDYGDPFFADAEGDGDLDMLIGTNAAFGKVGLRFFENLGTASQSIWREDSTLLAEVYQNPAGYSSRSPILMHANNDSLMDLVIVFVIEGIAGVVVYPGQRDFLGFRWSGETEVLRIEGDGPTILPFDIDHDGQQDLIVREVGTSRTYLKNEGLPGYFEPGYFRLGPLRFRAASSALPIDYNHDNESEILTGGVSFVGIDESSKFRLYQKDLLGHKSVWRNTGWFNEVSFSTANRDFKFQLTDLNQNGRNDLVLSLPPNILQSFEHSDSSLQGEWRARNGLLAPFVMSGVRQDTIYADPSFADIDGDGDLDLLITAGPFPFPDTGRTQYRFYENLFLADTLVWKKRPDWLLGLGSNTYFRSSFIDLDHDNDFDLVFGTNEGTLLAYENSGDMRAPVWTLLPGVFTDIDVGSQAAPSFGDFDNDGRTDLFVGNQAGELVFYRNESTVSVAERTEEEPHSFELYQSYPNPFNPETKIVFFVPPNARQQRVAIKIFDLTGRLVRVLFDREVAAGRYEVMWDGRDAHNNELASGTYVYRLEAGSSVISKRMTLLR